MRRDILVIALGEKTAPAVVDEAIRIFNIYGFHTKIVVDLDDFTRNQMADYCGLFIYTLNPALSLENLDQIKGLQRFISHFFTQKKVIGAFNLSGSAIFNIPRASYGTVDNIDNEGKLTNALVNIDEFSQAFVECAAILERDSASDYAQSYISWDALKAVHSEG